MRILLNIIVKFSMGSGTRLTEEEIAKIVALKDNTGYSNRKIAKIINRSEKVVRNYLKNRSGYGKTPVSGRPPKVNIRQRRALFRSAANSLKCGNEIAAEMGLNVTGRRVRQILNECDHLERTKLLKKPMLSMKNINDRMQYAISHMSWVQEWNKIVFSDEKKFNLDGPDGWSHYWRDLRTEKKIFSKRQSGGGSVMVWGAIGYKKKCALECIDHRLSSEGYQEMVGPLFPAWGYEMAGFNWILQQDNAPIHVSRSTLAFFKQRNIAVMEDWPSKSPDMNIIENLWSILARKVYAGSRQFHTKQELSEAIIDAWAEIDQTMIQRLYHGLPQRMRALYDAKGRYTKY